MPEWATKTARRVTAGGWGVKESAAFRAPSFRSVRYALGDRRRSDRSGELRKRMSSGVRRSDRSGATKAPPPEQVETPRSRARRDGARFGSARRSEHRFHREGHRAGRIAEARPGARGAAGPRFSLPSRPLTRVSALQPEVTRSGIEPAVKMLTLPRRPERGTPGPKLRSSRREAVALRDRPSPGRQWRTFSAGSSPTGRIREQVRIVLLTHPGLLSRIRECDKQ